MAVEEETISFYGGPRHNQSQGWRGGDTAEFAVNPQFVNVPTFDQIGPDELRTALYVRSRRNPLIFVYQP